MIISTISRKGKALGFGAFSQDIRKIDPLFFYADVRGSQTPADPVRTEDAFVDLSQCIVLRLLDANSPLS